MTTKNILISGSQPSAEGPGSKFKVQSTKPGQEFAAAMDQAEGPGSKFKVQSAKPGQEFAAAMPRPAHSRSARSSARGRGADVPEAPSSEQSGQASRPESVAKPVARLPKVELKSPGVNEEQPALPADSSKHEKPVSSTVEGEDESGDSDELSLVAEEDSAEAAPAVPLNIVAFPVAMVPTAVIIPFPLLAAQVPTRGGTEDQGSRIKAQSSMLNIEGSKPDSDSSPAEDQYSTFNDVRRSTFNVPFSKPEDVQDGGIEVSELGLKPVTERESTELLRNVSPPLPPLPTVGTPNQASVVSFASNVIEVAFSTTTVESRAQTARTVHESATGSRAQLPGDPAKLEESAPFTSSPESSAKIVLLRTDASKTAAGVRLAAAVQPSAERQEVAGTTAAKQSVGMESTMTSEREKVAAERIDIPIEALPHLATSSSEREVSSTDFSARAQVATEWQTGRPVGVVDRADSDAQDVQTLDGTGTVERISSLIVRESALVKKHGSDSMAVVLRPDAETELFVHLSQRNGQVEATVRCERGDVQHLGALWSQLQESLAQHKVRLAPLQDAPSGQSNFNQSPGSGMSSGQNGTREEARPEKQSMDEWSASAPSTTSAPHVRGAGGSRSRRTTTSRPGWETWA